jgi:hypothetical protein
MFSMLFHTMASPIAKERLGALTLFTVTSSVLTESRHVLGQQALDWNATHLLWVDSDMSFPKDALCRMLARPEPIVAANYVQRKAPFDWTAQKKRGETLLTNPRSKGLETADRVGFGFLWMRAEILRKLPKPWFSFEWVDDPDHGEGTAGEDVGFCDRVRNELGTAIHVDHDLSKEMGHLGTFEFGPAIKWGPA